MVSTVSKVPQGKARRKGNRGRGGRLKLDLSKTGKSINRRKNLGTAGYRPGTAGEVLLAENYSKNHRSHGRKLRVP